MVAIILIQRINMPITASVNTSFAATSVSSTGLTVTSAVTSQRDNYVFENGTAAGCVTAAFDATINIVSNSTTISLGSLTSTSGVAFGHTYLKALRFYNSSANGNVTITSNIAGFPVCRLAPDTSLVWTTRSAAGLTIASGNTITAAGITGNIAVLTMLVS